MLVDSFVAVTLEALDLPGLRWTSIARALQNAGVSTASTDATSDEDGAGDPDAVACLRVSRSAVASLQGLDGFRNLLALAVPQNGLSGMDSQVSQYAFIAAEPRQAV